MQIKIGTEAEREKNWYFFIDILSFWQLLFYVTVFWEFLGRDCIFKIYGCGPVQGQKSVALRPQLKYIFTKSSLIFMKKQLESM